MKKSLQLTAFSVLCGLSLPQLAAQGTLKVFLLAGQSNCEGHAYAYDSTATAGWNIPTLQFLEETPDYLDNVLPAATYTFASSFSATWKNPRTDVWAVQYDSVNGAIRQVEPSPASGSQSDWEAAILPLSPGFGASDSYSALGPELGMGTYLGDLESDPVFLVKSDHGGRSLAVDFRPPSAVEARGGVVGGDFTSTVGVFSTLFDDLDDDLADDGILNNSINPLDDPLFGNATAYEICGFIWFQGWNDMGNADRRAEYEANLVDLAHDLRASDPRLPADLPIIVVESADQNVELNTARANAVATLDAGIPGSAVFVETNDLKGHDWSAQGYPFTTGFGSHYNSRAENYLQVGWLMGEAVLDNSYLTASSFWLVRPEVTSIEWNQAGVSTSVNEPADTVTVYWGTNDPGPQATGWINGGSMNLGSFSAGAIPATLTGLSEDTTYFFRFHATRTSPADEFWSDPNSFTTPLQFPVPEMTDPVVFAVLQDGASVESTLLLADADVTLVWALADHGELDVATWTSAPGGDSQSFPASIKDDLVFHDITGIDPNTKIFFRFYAANANGFDWSTAGSFTTPRDVAYLTAYYDFEGAGADRFDDPAGDFADDLVGQYNPAFAADSPGVFAGSQCASFDSNSALFTDAFTSDLGPDPNAFTIMFWVKAADADQENNNTRLMTSRILPSGSASSYSRWQVEGFGNNGSNGNKMDVRMSGSGLPTNWFSPDATNALANTGETVEWHHVAFVLANSGHSGDGGAYGRTFVDGFQVGSIYNPDDRYDGIDIANQDGQLIIGGHTENAGGRAFTGLLDDVALFAGVVTDGDIAAIAAGTMSPADFLPSLGITITSVEVVGSNVEVVFSAAANTAYKMTESPDLSSGFVDTAPLVEATTGPSGTGTMIWPLSGAKGFGRVETK